MNLLYRLILELIEENSSVRLLQMFEYSGCIVPKQFLNKHVRFPSQKYSLSLISVS